MTVLLPIFVFRAVALAPITDFNLAALARYATAQGVLYTLGLLIARKVFCLGVSESLLLGFCGVIGNSAYYVLPAPTHYRSTFWPAPALPALWPFRWHSFIQSAQTPSCR